MDKERLTDLKEIAERTGFSVSTVSRVLKHKGELAPATRTKVLEMAARLGYHGNRLSDAMRTGKTGVVGVVMGIDNPFFNRLFRHIHDELRQRDYLPLIAWGENCDEAIIRRLIEQRADGIIIVPHRDYADNRYFKEVTERGVPIVSVDRKTHADIDFVGTDDFLGGQLMAEHLYSLGHRRLGFYHGYPDASPAILRRQGFEDFCRHHPDCGVELIGKGNWSLESDASLADFLRSHPQVTAVGTITDYHARQLVQVATGMGRRVPRDLAVVGFGDLEPIWRENAILTSLDQKPALIAAAAVETLFRRIDSPDRPKETIESRVKPELIVRRSSVDPTQKETRP